MLSKLKSLFRREPEPVVTTDTIAKLPTVMIRAVGYCRTDGCTDFVKGKFVYSSETEPRHFCSVCKQFGMVIKEDWSVKYPGNMDFYQVRVEYDFRPSLIPTGTGRWAGVAIVTDTSLPDTGNIYYLQSPLIKTDKRALDTATAILAGLLRDPEAVIALVPGSKGMETRINFDAPLGEVKAQLWELEGKLRGSRLSRDYEAQ